jgi:hypothetical protein
MGRLGAALGRFFSVGAIPDCARCGKGMTPIREERITSTPAVFEITCRCETCGDIPRVRQVVEFLN